ncbi:MAG: glycosyltransferase [Ardenticatenaceae bacterium]|nr:glycosyltransferase [Ardenticatenaceae bacterium]
MTDIVCFSSTDWDGVWGSRQQVMVRFARRGYRVLFVERPIGLEHFVRYPAFRQRKLRRWREGLRRVEDNLWIVSLPLLLPGKYYSPFINRINQKITLAATRRYERQLDFSEPILWLYNPEQGELIGQFQEKLSVYHCIDEWTAATTGRKRRTITALESDLLRKVDVVFANSLPTYENKRRHNPQTYRIPSGVDVDHFNQVAEIAEHPAIAGLPRPRIGYSGHINERLDYDVLDALARQRTDWTLVFVGDTYPWTMDAPPLRRLAVLPNVYFLGKYPFADMPALLKGMDICLLPYIDDERGYFRSPLKLYEYLAAGKPVISTPHPEAAEFAELVYQAASPEAFIHRAAQALGDDNAEKQRQRQLVARQHSWDRRVDVMERIIRSFL